MTAAELRILIQEGEGTTLEFKENLSAAFARELVGMANTIGGRILLGVRDDGTVVGVKDTNNLRARIQDIARNCDPPVKVLAEPVGEVLVVRVRESEAKPVQCSDGFFWRQGAVTQKLSREEIRDFFRSEGAIRFDLSVCPKFRYPQDFDRAKFDAWLERSRISVRKPVEDILVNIDAAERSGGKLLFRNAGVLFFAKNVRHFFNQAYITCLLAKGTSKADILDRKDFDGGIVADIEDAMRFIERNTRTAWRIEKIQREDIPEYPMKALREAIINAVMHRDWFMEGANVFVELYTDRIEVSSPGGLPKGMTLSDLGHKSIRRNALIADLLHRIEFIEKAGTGIRRIRDEARAQGCPEPRFEETGFFTATFYPNPEVRAQSAAHSAGATGQVGAHVPHMYPTSPRQVGTELGPSQDQVTPEVGIRPTSQSPGKITPQVPGEVPGEVTPEVSNKYPASLPKGKAQSGAQSGAQSDRVLMALSDGDRSAGMLAEAIALRSKTGSLKRTLAELLAGELIEYTVPAKPSSRLQRYRLTQAGIEYLKKVKER